MAEYRVFDFIVLDDGTIINARNRRVCVERNGFIHGRYNGAQKAIRKEKLIYMAMTGQTLPNYQRVRFKDGDNTNFDISNLEPVPMGEAKNKGYVKQVKTRITFTQEQVDQILYEFRMKRMKQKELAEKYGCPLSYIARITSGRYGKCRKESE